LRHRRHLNLSHTKVLCTASIDNSVPRFLKGKGQGWVTAEYGMLPRSTHTRSDREAARGKQSGRTQEIQRLIGRSLRAMVDLKKLGENTITIDCDVIQADGGTRTAAITGAAVALIDAMNTLLEKKKIKQDPLKGLVAAISVGIFLIGERWGGSALIRAAVEREIAFLIDDFAHELTRIESMQHIHDSEDLKVLANILMDASFNWAMRWIGLSRDVAPEKLQQQQAAFKLQTIVQIQLMFRGISNWQRPSAQTKHANPTLH
jgi:hypothetical protein